MGGVIILGMNALLTVRSKFLVAMVATFVFAALLAAVVAGQSPEPVSSGQDRIEVISPAGVVTFEGELREPW